MGMRAPPPQHSLQGCGCTATSGTQLWWDVYYAPTRRTVHLFTNCVGLASVRPRDIITEQLCLNCRVGMIIGKGHEGSTHFLVVGDIYTPHVFPTCVEIRGWARQIPICLHCRQHHFVRDD